MRIELLPAAPADQPALDSLMLLYVGDLHRHGERPGAADADLGRYWSEPGYRAFLIRADSALAGFALVSRASRIHADFDGHCLTDLFVLHQARRAGVASEAAIQLFARLPGRWELAAAAANIPATAFCRALSQRYTCGDYHETWAGRGGWRGSVDSFVAPPPCRS